MLGKKVVVFVSSETIKEAIKLASSVGASDRITLVLRSKMKDDKVYQGMAIRANSAVSQAIVPFNGDVIQQMAEKGTTPIKILTMGDKKKDWSVSQNEFVGELEYDIPFNVAKTLQSMADVTDSFLITMEESFVPFAQIAKEGRDYEREEDVIHYKDAKTGDFIDRYATADEAKCNLSHSSDGTVYDNGQNNRPGTDTEREVKKDAHGEYISVSITVSAKEDKKDSKKDAKKEGQTEAVEVFSKKIYKGEDGRFSIPMNQKLTIESSKPAITSTHALLPYIAKKDIRKVKNVEALSLAVKAAELSKKTRSLQTAFTGSDEVFKNYCLFPEIDENGSCKLSAFVFHSNAYATGTGDIAVEEYSKNIGELLPKIREACGYRIPVPASLVETVLSLAKDEDKVKFTLYSRDGVVFMTDIKTGGAVFTFSVNKNLDKNLNIEHLLGVYSKHDCRVEFKDPQSLAKLIKIASLTTEEGYMVFDVSADAVKVKIANSNAKFSVGGDEVESVEISGEAAEISLKINSTFVLSIIKNLLPEEKFILNYGVLPGVGKGAFVIGEGKDYRMVVAPIA